MHAYNNANPHHYNNCIALLVLPVPGFASPEEWQRAFISCRSEVLMTNQSVNQSINQSISFIDEKVGEPLTSS